MTYTYRESFLDVEELRERGWTETLIEKHLGAAEAWLGVDHWANFTGKRAWSVERVVVTEHKTRFIEDFKKSIRRRRCKPQQIKNFNAARKKTEGRVKFLQIPLRENKRPKESSTLKLLKTRKQISYTTIDLDLFSCFLAAGIVNPFGPTLSCLGTLGKWKPGNVLHLVYMSVNPFSTNAEIVGEVNIGKSTNWFELIEQSAAEMKGLIATLLFANRNLTPEQASTVFQSLVKSYPNVSAILERLEKYFGNPVERVSVEIKSAIESLNAQGGQIKEADASEVRRLTELFMDNKHRDMEIKAFLKAWEGAIGHAKFMPTVANIGEAVNILTAVLRMVDWPDISDEPLPAQAI
jgi:hypothetical protein